MLNRCLEYVGECIIWAREDEDIGVNKWSIMKASTERLLKNLIREAKS